MCWDGLVVSICKIEVDDRIFYIWHRIVA
jgi:hypothetical protein